MSDLDRALSLVLAHEGGWSDNPRDRGGKTMFGITGGTLRDARKRMDGLPLNIRELTQDQARRIYTGMYWRPTLADLLPWPVNYLAFDSAVQHGVPRAVKILQAAIGAVADGVIGPETRAKVGLATDWGPIMTRMLVGRAAHYMRIMADDPSQAEAFGRGWANRLESVAWEALS